MNRQHKMSKADQRAQWMAEYERLVVAAKPELTGRIDWDTATYLYLSGVSVTAAAQRAIGRAS